MSRIFLLGNGPSLLKTPLNKLAGKATMGVNKIGALFRPTFYVKVDYSPFDGGDWKDEIMLDRPCLLWDVFRDGVKDPDAPFGDWIPQGMGDHPNATWVTRCAHHGVNGNPGVWHDPFCTAYNSISIMAQWAVRLGYTEIVLLGCDLNFTDGRDDHFMPYYNTVDRDYTERNNRCALEAHKLIARSCPVPVYNATVGGSLEVHPRVDIERML